jgi:hypothetical protein
MDLDGKNRLAKEMVGLEEKEDEDEDKVGREVREEFEIVSRDSHLWRTQKEGTIGRAAKPDAGQLEELPQGPWVSRTIICLTIFFDASFCSPYMATSLLKCS